jgi:hypothetical protein
MRGITAHSIRGRMAFMAEKAPAAASGEIGGRGSPGVQSFLLWWGQSPAGRYFTKYITHHEH